MKLMIEDTSTDIAHIQLTNGYTATIDLNDFPLVTTKKWSARVELKRDGTLRTVYARHGSLILHRFILNVKSGEHVDHINGNGLDCRRSNMRIVDHQKNMHNYRKPCNNTSGIKGVCWSKRAGKWVAQIKVNGVKKGLGYFYDIDDARNAYEVASRVYHGENGRID